MWVVDVACFFHYRSPNQLDYRADHVKFNPWSTNHANVRHAGPIGPQIFTFSLPLLAPSRRDCCFLSNDTRRSRGKQNCIQFSLPNVSNCLHFGFTYLLICYVLMWLPFCCILDDRSVFPPVLHACLGLVKCAAGGWSLLLCCKVRTEQILRTVGSRNLTCNVSLAKFFKS